MAPALNKRPKRVPLSQEEVNQIIAIKKKRELVALYKLKKSLSYKIQNIFNLICFFIYFEILFCYFGPCNYHNHYSYKVASKFGNRSTNDGKLIISDVDFYCVNGKTYNLVVNDYIEMPENKSRFTVGSDFLLNKELKARIGYGMPSYRIFEASSVLFLVSMVSFVMLVAYSFNLNHNAFSLMGLTILNCLNLLGIFFL